MSEHGNNEREHITGPFIYRDYDVEISRSDSLDDAVEFEPSAYDIKIPKGNEEPSTYIPRYKRSGHNGSVKFPFIWKLLVFILIISNIGLWYTSASTLNQLRTVNEQLVLAPQSAGTLFVGNSTAGNDGPASEEPVEEDSIRAWEEEHAIEEEPETPVSGIRKVYLTFDDGPSRYTDTILDILDEYGVKATFFVVAQGKDVYKDSLKRIVDDGHTLGMHSFTHVYKDIYSSREAFIQDINQLQDYIHEATGIYPDYYRFPGGSSTGLGKAKMEELEDYLKEIGVEWYDWNISSGDATGKLSADTIFKNSIGKIENYSDAVILFHDAADKATTVEALPRIIEYILSLEDTIIVPITSSSAPVKHKSK